MTSTQRLKRAETAMTSAINSHMDPNDRDWARRENELHDAQKAVAEAKAKRSGLRTIW